MYTAQQQQLPSKVGEEERDCVIGAALHEERAHPYLHTM
jgi:hypothetical protein